MTTPTIDNLTYDRLPGADGTFLNVAHGGEGAPIVLLHGFP